MRRIHCRPPLHYADAPVHDFLRTAAEISPERVCLRFEDSTLTFREMDAWGTAAANAFADLHIGIADRVLVAMSNRPECLMAQHGASQIGAASVVVNPSWKHHELERALEVTRPVAVVADSALSDVLQAIEGVSSLARVCVDEERPQGWLSFWDLNSTAKGERPKDIDADLGRLECLLPFSSGTTGLAKAVRHTHRSLRAAITQRVAAYGITDSDRLQFFMPLCTIYGINCSLSAVAARASLRLFRRFEVRRVLENLEAEAITLAFGGAPVAIALRDCPDLEKYDLSALRWMMWGATPVLPDVAAEVTERSGIRWMQAYSTTEIGIASNPAEDPDRFRLDSPGFALSDVRIRTVSPETGADLPEGELGELVVHSPSVMLGYLPEEDNEGAFLPDGALRTGDLGWVDSEGWIHLTDRVKELIKVSGFQVAPAELERILSTCPGVVDCAVYGVHDERRGEVPIAAVVAATPGSPTAEEVMEFISTRLARYKHLAGVVFLDTIPRNAGGKVLRRELKAIDPRS